MKAHEFRRFLDLPARVDPARIELVLSIDAGDEADRLRLEQAGFVLRNPADAAGTPWAFAEHVAASWGEWSVAQGVYVHGCTGWLSDRSAHYLAAGRPVVVQDTNPRVPTGAGLRTFHDVASAATALDQVVADPVGASQAARDLAERRFGSDVVLSELCTRIGVAP